jgi:Tfp pilus assembly protein PilO
MKKHGTAFIGIISALVACLVAGGAYGVWYSAVADASAEGARLETELKNREAAGGRAATARRSLEELAEQESRVASYLVSSSEIVPFLESLEGVGDVLGAEVDVVSVGDSPDTSGRIPLSLSISGSFNAVMRTVGAIEHHPNDVRVTSLTLDTPQGDAASSEWTANVTFSVGMRGQAEPIAP